MHHAVVLRSDGPAPSFLPYPVSDRLVISDGSPLTGASISLAQWIAAYKPKPKAVHVLCLPGPYSMSGGRSRRLPLTEVLSWLIPVSDLCPISTVFPSSSRAHHRHADGISRTGAGRVWRSFFIARAGMAEPLGSTASSPILPPGAAGEGLGPRSQAARAACGAGLGVASTSRGAVAGKGPSEARRQAASWRFLEAYFR